MVCVVVSRNGHGDVWAFGSLPEARQHPIPQMDDVFATDGASLVEQYGRGEISDILWVVQNERERARIAEMTEAWQHMPRASAVLHPEAVETLWKQAYKAAKFPPTDPAEIVRIVVADRAYREGKTLRSLPGPDAWPVPERKIHITAQKGRAMPDTATKTRASKIADNSTITIATEEKKNPKRAGSKGAARFDLYKDGMTVAQAKEAGVTAADLAYDSGKGFITIAPGAAAPESDAAE